MFRKLVKHLTNNLGLKILSILFALVLWLVVVNFDDPNMTKPFSVPVTVINQEIIEKMGKVYDVVNQSDTAVFYVTGKRSDMDRLTSDDFTATADLSQVDLTVEGDTKLVPIEVTVAGGNNQLSITRKTNNLQITIEDLAEKKLQVSVDAQGELADGYAIGEKTVAPNLVTVSGPRSIVSQVNSVSASVDVSGASSDITNNIIPVFYDKNGRMIESDRLKMNLETVEVTITIWGTKDVPVYCQTSGKPAEGYRYTELEFAPETVTIKGEPDILNTIHEITIPEDAINLEGATANVENTIDITPYLEEVGVFLVDETESKIAVKAIVEALETKSLEVPVSSIIIQNLKEEYKMEFGTATINVLVRGLGEELSTLTADQLHPVIDASEFTTDTVNAEVAVGLEEKYELVGNVSVKVQVLDKDNAPEGTGGDGTAGGSGTPENNGGTGGTSGSGGNTGGTGGASGGIGNTGGASGSGGSSGGSGTTSGESSGTSGSGNPSGSEGGSNKPESGTTPGNTD